MKAVTHLSVEFIQEDDNVIVAYCPALDVSTSGSTLEEAQKNFEECYKLFIEETNKMGTLEDVLLDCGWKKIKVKDHKEYAPPLVIHRIEEPVKIPCPS
ncbi:type II toxin-antitoxin system HicB family antitoxin [Candidatus Margulisiibacteriota bacterium]